jgi:hypothetical protein
MPARRSGKANSRQARQKRQQQRSSQRASLQQPMARNAGGGGSDIGVGGEATAARPATAAAAAATAPARPAKPTSKFTALYGSSRLTEQAHLEYHYVERDLRNIGILVLVMIGMLIVATIAFNLLGIGPR